MTLNNYSDRELELELLSRQIRKLGSLSVENADSKQLTLSVVGTDLSVLTSFGCWHVPLAHLQLLTNSHADT